MIAKAMKRKFKDVNDKKDAEKDAKKDIGKLKDRFQRIHISSFNLVADPILRCILGPWCCCLKRVGQFKRQEFMDKASDKFASELDVVNIMNTIRNMNDMLENLKEPQHDFMLNFTKQRVIELGTESSASSEDPYFIKTQVMLH